VEDNNSRKKLFDLLFKEIQCHNKSSGAIKKYMVVDCLTSSLDSEYVIYVLEDDQGRKEHIMVQELLEL